MGKESRNGVLGIEGAANARNIGTEEEEGEEQG